MVSSHLLLTLPSLEFRPWKPRNLMVSRMVVNLAIMCILRLCWVVEQPASSLLEHHGLFVWLCKNFKVFKAPWTIILRSSKWFGVCMSQPFQFPLQPVALHPKAFVWMGALETNVESPFKSHSENIWINSLKTVSSPAPGRKHIKTLVQARCKTHSAIQQLWLDWQALLPTPEEQVPRCGCWSIPKVSWCHLSM